jgi:hypothetical protein
LWGVTLYYIPKQDDPRPDEIPSAGELPLATYQLHVIPSPAFDEVVTAVGVGGASSSSMPPGSHQDLAMVAADTTIQTVGPAKDRYVQSPLLVILFSLV